MKPTLVIDPEAKSEFDDAYDYYQNRQIGWATSSPGRSKRPSAEYSHSRNVIRSCCVKSGAVA